MRRKLLPFIGLLFCNSIVSAQLGGIVTTVAGNTSGITTLADGVPATDAQFFGTTGLAVDNLGNVYIGDYASHRIRKVNPITGIITTAAGNGTMGFSGDGGPATSAMLSTPKGIFIDAANNLYIADSTGGRIRKVTAATGIITTIAGGGASTANGVPATTANIGNPVCVYVDNAGNIYTTDATRIRKVNPATGIITTIAGGGASTAEGVPATTASIGRANFIGTDHFGNLLIVPSSSDRIRMIDAATGLISTIAGGGTLTANGVPAYLASLANVRSFAVDTAGNLYVTDHGNLIRAVNFTTGLITTIAGGGISIADGVPALNVLCNPYMICSDISANIYYSNNAELVRKFNYSSSPFLTYWTDSFTVNINPLCEGPQLTASTNFFGAGMSIKTYYGDGTSDILPLLGGSGYGGYAVFNHAYTASGTYTIKMTLYHGIIPVDSLSRTYNHIYCDEIPVKFYYDINGGCSKDSADPFLLQPVLTEVDSNWVPVDTISSTSGFYYYAHGTPGDIYHFRILSLPGNFHATCPSSGIIADTLQPAVYNNKVLWFGLNCTTSSVFDFSVNACVPVTGINDQWGNIYLQNSGCSPANAFVTMNFSSKYQYTGGATPAPVLTTATSLTWNLTGLSAANSDQLYFVLWHNPASGYLTDGDTVHDTFTITPMTGDADTTNNTIIVVDTVKAGTDPNHISVSSTDCIQSGDTLHFTIQFENTGHDTAFNIYVMDTLSDNLDPSTMRMKFASNEMYVSKLKGGGHNILKFDFPGINLLDSAHHGLCDGMLMYDIKPFPSLPSGTSILSRAGIYFDYNDVVMTNTAGNTQCWPAHVATINKTSTVSLFPNPATDELTIKTEQPTFTSFTIANSVGQSLIQQDITGIQTKVNVKSLPSGVYFVTIRGAQGNEVKKLVKW